MVRMLAGTVAFGWLAAACVEPSATPCADGSVCASAEACAPSGGCADRDLLAACDGLADGVACDAAGLGGGACSGGVCTLRGCGNGAVDDGEACDDGNTTSADGCRADCGKVEVCGDALVDAGEACDDGNGNDADACTATCAATTWTATSLLDGAPLAVEVGLRFPIGVAVDRAGRTYIADSQASVVRRVDSTTGELVTIAGTGAYGYSGDGGPAAAATLGSPEGVAVDGLGNVYIADAGQRVIRIVEGSSGRISTFAGTGASGDTGDGGPATAARFVSPVAVAVDGLGAVYVVDAGAHRVRKIDAGIIQPVAGIGSAGASGDGGPAVVAALSNPRGIAIAPDGSLFVADAGNDRLRVVSVDGLITSLASGGALPAPLGVAVGADGQPLVIDFQRAQVLRVEVASGEVTAVAGDGGIAFGGDGGPAVAARLAYPRGLAADSDGRIVIADTVNQRIRRVDVDGIITTIAGNGVIGEVSNGGGATSAELYRPDAALVAADGTIYIAETGQHRVWRVDPTTRAIVTIAGRGVAADGGDGGPATAAGLRFPGQLALDGDGGLLIADSGNHRVRRVALATGMIETVAGTGVAGNAGDAGPATSATLRDPRGLLVADDGVIYVADTGNHRVRQIVDGQMSAFAGTGVGGGAGDGGPALAATFRAPTSLARDAAGALYVADRDDDRVRKILGGQVSAVAGPAAPDGGLDGPSGVAVDAAGDVLIADTLHHRVVRIVAGEATPVAGLGYGDFSGDGGPATNATLSWPAGVTVGPDGDVYVVDTYLGFIRRIGADGVIVTVAGAVDPFGGGPLAQARLATPRALVRAAPFTLFAGGASGTVQAIRTDGDRLETLVGRYPNTSATADLARFRRGNFPDVRGVAYDDAAQRLYLVAGNTIHIVRWTDRDDVLTWTIDELSDPSNVAAYRDGALAFARFSAPAGLLLDDDARILYVADAGNHVIRAVDLTINQVSTVVGTPAVRGYFGDGLAATEALLDGPTAITRGPGGELYVADTGNHRIRRVDPGSGIITTVLGDGVAASSGDGAPATSFPVDAPAGLAADARGNLYVSSTNVVRQLVADDLGVVDGSGVVRTIYGAPPRDVFPATATACRAGVVVVDASTVWTVDACAGLLVALTRTAAP